MKNNKIVVFDLDETLGYFTQLGVFCDCLNEYFQDNTFSDNHFNEILDLYQEFLRPKIIQILNYLKQKKKEKKCFKVMIYTNNQGPKIWAENIKKYFDDKIQYNLFDQIIAAFKIRGERVELNRTSHDKSIDDLFRCTQLPHSVEICFIDDIFHNKMEDEKVYYINVKPYHYTLNLETFILRFLESNMGKKVKSKNDFINKINEIYKYYNFNATKKDKQEQEIDIIVGKKMFQHIKHFFYENNKHTVRNNRKNKSKNKRHTTLKKKRF